MATIGSEAITMADWVKRLGPDNKVGKVIEILNTNNPITEDAPTVQCNNGTSHTTIVRSELPVSAFRRLNEGVPVSKSRTSQIEEQTGVLETWAEVDMGLLELAEDRNGYLLTENKPYLESLKQQQASTLFYGSRAADPASFNGLACRYNTRDPNKSEKAANVLGMGGTGNDNTSIWLVAWGDTTLHLINPKGTTAGVSYETFDNQVTHDANGNPYTVHRTHYKWYNGLVVKDWRYVMRIANIPTSNLQALINDGAGTPADSKLVRAMIERVNMLPDTTTGKLCWYMNRGVKTQLELMAAEKANVNLQIEYFEGKPVTLFRGIPIRQCDAIINNEEQVA